MQPITGELNMQDRKQVHMEEQPGDRLRRARISYGYASASEAARRLGRRTPTYIAHENGTRSFTAEEAIFYGGALKVNPVWLLFGDGYATPGRENIEGRPRRQPIFVSIKNEPKALALEVVPIGEWRVPERFISDHLNIPCEHARILECVGGSDKPLSHYEHPDVPCISSGDRLIVDVSDKTPDPLAFFVVRESDSLVFRGVRFVGADDGTAVEVSSPFNAARKYVIEHSKVEIFGRVKGKFGIINL